MSGWIAAAALAGIAGLLGWRVLQARERIERLQRALARSGADLERVQRTFQRFAPEHVVEQLSDEMGAVHGETRDVTIMFADIVGFTTLSEQIDPTTTVHVLNGYFTAMDKAIAANHGRISRIMGDGLLALFGALEDNPWHVADAVRAALAMREALDGYNAQLRAESLPELKIGIGLNRGRVVVGVMGSPEKKEYTAIGEDVNIAARVEALSRQHGVEIVLTDAVKEALDARFTLRSLPAVPLKGVSRPVRTWTVESYSNTRVDPETK